MTPARAPVIRFSVNAAPCLAQLPAHNIAQRSGSEEILLPQAEFQPGRAVISRIKYLRDRLGPHLLGQRAVMVAPIEDFKAQWIG